MALIRPLELAGLVTPWPELTPEEQRSLIQLVDRAKRERAATRVVVMEVSCCFDRPVRSWTVVRIET